MTTDHVTGERRRLKKLLAFSGVVAVVWLCISGLGTVIFLGLRDNAPTSGEMTLGFFCMLEVAGTLLAVILNFKADRSLQRTGNLRVSRFAGYLNLAAGLMGLVQVGWGMSSERYMSTDEKMVFLSMALPPLVLLFAGMAVGALVANVELLASGSDQPPVSGPPPAAKPAPAEQDEIEVNGVWDQERKSAADSAKKD